MRQLLISVYLSAGYRMKVLAFSLFFVVYCHHLATVF